MFSNFLLADVISRIKTACKNGSSSVLVPSSKFVKNFVEVLFREGYVASFAEVGGTQFPVLEVFLSYRNGVAGFEEMMLVSKPGLRVYVGKRKIPSFRNGLGTVILSSNKGLVTGREAKALGTGGEVICKVF